MGGARRVAVLGIGAMGERIAGRLVDGGCEVVVWNRTRERTAALAERGARVAATPREAATGAETVISIVTDDGASRAVWLDPEAGALSALAPGAIALEMSTVTPEHVRSLAAEFEVRERALLEAPVLGSRPQAEAGALVVLTGGDSAAAERSGDLLSHLSGRTEHCGPHGHAATVKLAVNAYFATQVAGLAEVLGSLRRAGLADDRITEILDGLPVVAPALRLALGAMVEAEFAPQFPIDLVAKDLRYFVEQSGAGGAGSVVDRVREVYVSAAQHGLGGLNLTAVSRRFGVGD